MPIVDTILIITAILLCMLILWLLEQPAKVYKPNFIVISLFLLCVLIHGLVTDCPNTIGYVSCAKSVLK